MNKTFTITPVHDVLLRGSTEMPIGLYQLHLATAEQLTRLHYKQGMHKTVLKRLKMLTDHGFVQTDATAIKHKDATGRIYFTTRYYYALGRRGLQFLDHLGLDTPLSARARKDIATDYVHIGHYLELNDIFIAALRLKCINPRYYLSRRIDNRSFQRDPLLVAHHGVTQRLEPDSFLEIRNRGTNSIVPLLLEHDRGTEQQAVFKRKIGKYKALLYEQSYKRQLQVTSITVCFTTCMNERRMMQIRRWVQQELRDAPELSSMFLFAELPIPPATRDFLFEQVWYNLTGNQPSALLEE